MADQEAVHLAALHRAFEQQDADQRPDAPELAAAVRELTDAAQTLVALGQDVEAERATELLQGWHLLANLEATADGQLFAMERAVEWAQYLAVDRSPSTADFLARETRFRAAVLAEQGQPDLALIDRGNAIELHQAVWNETGHPMARRHLEDAIIERTCNLLNDHLPTNLKLSLLQMRLADCVAAVALCAQQLLAVDAQDTEFVAHAHFAYWNALRDGVVALCGHGLVDDALRWRHDLQAALQAAPTELADLAQRFVADLDGVLAPDGDNFAFAAATRAAVDTEPSANVSMRVYEIWGPGPAEQLWSVHQILLASPVGSLRVKHCFCDTCVLRFGAGIQFPIVNAQTLPLLLRADGCQSVTWSVQGDAWAEAIVVPFVQAVRDAGIAQTIEPAPPPAFWGGHDVVSFDTLDALCTFERRVAEWTAAQHAQIDAWLDGQLTGKEDAPPDFLAEGAYLTRRVLQPRHIPSPPADSHVVGLLRAFLHGARVYRVEAHVGVFAHQDVYGVACLAREWGLAFAPRAGQPGYKPVDKLTPGTTADLIAAIANRPGWSQLLGTPSCVLGRAWSEREFVHASHQAWRYRLRTWTAADLHGATLLLDWLADTAAQVVVAGKKDLLRELAIVVRERRQSLAVLVEEETLAASFTTVREACKRWYGALNEAARLVEAGDHAGALVRVTAAVAAGGQPAEATLGVERT